MPKRFRRLLSTAGPKDATRIVEERGTEYDYIVCSGGDGTMNEVATGLMSLEQKPVCGYIPAGTVNDFASSLSIPKVMEFFGGIAMAGTLAYGGYRILQGDMTPLEYAAFNTAATFGP